jgi:hypothetical protein
MMGAAFFTDEMFIFKNKSFLMIMQMKGGLTYTTGFFRQELSLLSNIIVLLIISNECLVKNLLEEKKKEEGIGYMAEIPAPQELACSPQLAIALI